MYQKLSVKDCVVFLYSYEYSQPINISYGNFILISDYYVFNLFLLYQNFNILRILLTTVLSNH